MKKSINPILQLANNIAEGKGAHGNKMNEAQESAYSEMSAIGWEFEYTTDEGEPVMVMREYLYDSQRVVSRAKIDKSGIKIDLPAD